MSQFLPHMAAPLFVKTPIIRDSFNRTLAANNGKGYGNADTHQPWIALQQKSTMFVDPTKGAAVTSAATFALAVIDTGTSDIDISAVFSAMSGTLQGIAVWVADISNFVYVRLSTAAITILSRQGGTYTTRASYSTTVPVGSTVRVQTSGSFLSVFVNGIFQVSWEDNIGSGGGRLYQGLTRHGFVLANSAANLRSIAFAPVNGVSAANRNIQFSDNFQTGDLSNYSVIFHRETINFVADPLGSGKQVIRMDVPNTATGPTSNPRCQMSPPHNLMADTEFWGGFAVLFPSGSGPTAGVTPFPTMPEGNSGFMNICQVYTSEPVSSAPTKLGFRAGSGQELMWQRNVTYGNDRPWNLGGPVEKDKWYEFVYHSKLSADPTVGFNELYMRTSTAGGWVKQTFFPGTPQQTDKLFMKTLDPAANLGLQRWDIQLYRSVNMFNNVSIYFSGHKVGYNLSQADPGIY